jgi:hypothetical protein
LGNYCEYFELARRVYAPPRDDNPRESAARAALNKLLGG